MTPQPSRKEGRPSLQSVTLAQRRLRKFSEEEKERGRKEARRRLGLDQQKAA